MKYKAIWEVDVEADTPEAAARAARHCQRPGTTALVFNVVVLHSGIPGHTIEHTRKNVDLTEPGDPLGLFNDQHAAGLALDGMEMEMRRLRGLLYGEHAPVTEPRPLSERARELIRAVHARMRAGGDQYNGTLLECAETHLRNAIVALEGVKFRDDDEAELVNAQRLTGTPDGY